MDHFELTNKIKEKIIFIQQDAGSWRVWSVFGMTAGVL